MNNTTTKITGKTTKEELVNIINVGYSKVADQSLKDRIVYTAKEYKKDANAVTKDVLITLAKDVVESLKTLVAIPTTPTLAPVEASVKPKLTGKKKEAKAEAPTETPKEEVKEEVKETTAEKTEKADKPKLSSKKKAEDKKVEAPKEEEKKAEVETAEDITKMLLPMAKLFPQSFEHKSLGTIVACPDKYSTIEEIAKAIEEGTELVFATYWTKRHLKEFAYGVANDVPVPKSGFPYDLDILQVVYTCDGIKRLYATSTYTEAMFKFDEEDLARVECESPSGDKFSMRYSAGLEYEIYEVVPQTEETK